MSIALVHDYLIQLGGAEKVLSSLERVYANSPIFVLLYNKNKAGDIFPEHKIHSTWLQYLPLSHRNYQWYLTLMPWAASRHRLKNYDIVISSASSFAKNIQVSEDSLHICYCHTPTRFLWHDADSYVEELNYPRFIKKIIPLFLPRLRHLDFLAAQKIDYFIANSRVVQERIKKYYQRDSVVIYPPVNTDFFAISNQPGNYYLAGGRLVAYKKYDLAIRAFNKLGLPLKIFGDGPERQRLQKMAFKNIEFLGPVDDQIKKNLYADCLAYLNPQVEDFGITAVEAMASGRPVIAFAAGGALETIIPGQTGEFFEEQTWESLAYRLLRFQPEKYRPALIKDHASQFSTKRFEEQIKNYIANLTQNIPQQKIFSMKI
ncbi:glycosyltransferase family 4 protein [Candidatus Kuenenbacteria bacterium]|nr:glycosyltransferase family 4 protein [Candidatus Kuenenbacteria bacterium]